MRKPGSVRSLETLGRVRLSPNFFMRDFLHSEIADFHRIPNIPDDPDLAITAGRHLCETLIEPLQATFGRIAVRSGYRAPTVNAFGNRAGLGCASNARAAGHHIWDRLDVNGKMGATACIVIPWLVDNCPEAGGWQRMAWWIHDHLPYSELYFFPKLWAFNITWSACPRRRIASYVAPRGVLTRPGMANHDASHARWYRGFPSLAD